MAHARTQCVPLGLAASFGFGDRIGLATPGHVAAMQRAGAGIAPIFPQQSIREMTRTGRTPEQVMDDALQGMQQTGWAGRTGADADHLKTAADVQATARAGYTFFTIDPSDFVDGRADGMPEAELRAAFGEVREEAGWLDDYVGREEMLPTGTRVRLDEEACMRCAVKYGRAMRHAIELGRCIQTECTKLRRPFEIELSVDETPHPTTLAEHYIIAAELQRHDVRLASLAPRFVGTLEKGVDYIGDVAALAASLADHAAIAERLGPYKLSLHSGSDKLSIYAALARATQGRFHIKTAGTSYLEALRVAALHEPKLLREIVAFARERYPADRRTYHVHATLEGVPTPDALSDREQEQVYLERWDDVPEGRGFSAAGRQILHCTFGSVLTSPRLGPALRACLDANIDTYTEVLAEHFTRHLRAIGL